MFFSFIKKINLSNTIENQYNKIMFETKTQKNKINKKIRKTDLFLLFYLNKNLNKIKKLKLSTTK